MIITSKRTRARGAPVGVVATVAACSALVLSVLPIASARADTPAALPVTSPLTPGQQCGPDSGDAIPFVDIRCINGVALRSRGRINPACFAMPLKTTYARGECYATRKRHGTR